MASTATQEPPLLDMYLKSWRLGIVTASLCLGTFLVALDVNIIGVALPKITSIFNSLDDVSWYGTAYLLTVTAFQPTMGFLYKSFNVRLVYFSNVVIFEIGSVLCAAAPTSSIFILGRAVAGLGAAGLLQGALAIVTFIVRLEKRPMYQGIVISVFGLSICVGPVMGGAFVDNISWRWCFWINLPIGGVAMIMLVLFLRVYVTETEHRNLPALTKLKKMDLGGTILFIAAICCLVLALQWGGQTMPWKSANVIGLLIGFGLLIFLFGFIQYQRGEEALIPLRILGQRSILVGSIFLFFLGMFNYVYSYFLPFYFQTAQGVSPVTSGVRIIPFVLAQIVFVSITGILVSRWGYYMPYMVSGMLICALGAGLVTRLDLSTPTAQWAAFLVIAGMGLGIAQQMPYAAVQIALSETDVPTGNALFVFFNQLGGIIAIPIAQTLFLSSLQRQLSQLLPTIDPAVVLGAGASNLGTIANGSLSVLYALQTAYSASLRDPYILALSATCAAVAVAPFMEWRNLKTEARDREMLRHSAEEDSSSQKGVSDMEKTQLDMGAVQQHPSVKSVISPTQEAA